MIPRYGPTYSWHDSAVALSKALMGHPTRQLRRELSRMYGAKHVFLVDGARVALFLLLRALGRPGRVILPAYNCIVVPEAVLYAGYVPLFVDIRRDSLNMTAHSVENSMSPDVTVVLATHQFGIPCAVDEIVSISRRHNVLVVEDAAAAIGAKCQGKMVGTFGDATIVSFHMTKVISGGIGGALLTSDDELASKVHTLLRAAASANRRLIPFLRAFAWKAATNPLLYPYLHVAYRLVYGEAMHELLQVSSEIPPRFVRTCTRFSAALVLMQLQQLDSNLHRRRELADMYRSELSEYSVLPAILGDCSPAWIQFPLLVGDRGTFYRYMQRKGVDLSWTYRYSCSDAFGLGGFPNADRAAKMVLGLPTYPSLSDEDAWYICAVAKEYLSTLS